MVPLYNLTNTTVTYLNQTSGTLDPSVIGQAPVLLDYAIPNNASNAHMLFTQYDRVNASVAHLYYDIGDNMYIKPAQLSNQTSKRSGMNGYAKYGSGGVKILQNSNFLYTDWNSANNWV